MCGSPEALIFILVGWLYVVLILAQLLRFRPHRPSSELFICCGLEDDYERRLVVVPKGARARSAARLLVHGARGALRFVGYSHNIGSPGFIKSSHYSLSDGDLVILDMALHDPVGGKKKANDSPSTSTGNNSSDAGNSEASLRPRPAAAASIALRVNNNKISSLNDMRDALLAVFDDPSQLQWLDLSGNTLSGIGRSTFAPYKDIFTLHLHGNKLHKYADVDNLAACLPRLHALTLHGNPVEEKKHYRNYVIANFPTLAQLDFSSITKGDREKAETWARIYKNALKGPKKHRSGGDCSGSGSGDQDN